MHIQINTDHNIEGHESMAEHVSNVVESALSQLSEHITRVEVHLSDENGPENDRNKGQNDKRCMMEARLEGYHPLAVTAHANTVHQAIDSAAEKLAHVIESTLGRMHDHKHRRDALPQFEENPQEALNDFQP